MSAEEKLAEAVNKSAEAQEKQLQTSSDFTPHRISHQDALDIIRSRMDENELAAWYYGGGDGAIREKLGEMAISDDELRNAGLNLLFDQWNLYGDRVFAKFEDFINSEIELYRGTSVQKEQNDVKSNFTSFSFNQKTAKNFMPFVEDEKNTPWLISHKTKIKDTLGYYGVHPSKELETFVLKEQVEGLKTLENANNAITQAKGEQIKLSQEATSVIETQATAEEKVAEAAEKTSKAKKFANTLSDLIMGDDDDAAETILSRTEKTADMIGLISSAAGKSAATKFLEGITDESDLDKRIVGYFNEVWGGNDWKFKEGKGAWSIKGDTYVANLVNDSQDALHAVFKLDEGVLKLQDDLLKFEGANIVDKFDLETAKAQANASLRDLKAQLGGRAYDGMTNLQSLFDNIVDEPSFNKFTQRCKIAKQEIAALKKEYSSGSGTLNDFSRATETMRNAERVIETMRLKLDSLGDADGVDKVTEALNNMETASKAFNAATDEAGQKNAYTQFNQAKADYEVNYDYAKEAKKAADAEAKQISEEEQKIQQYYQEILNTVNKINELDREIEQAKGKNKTGAFNEFIQKTQQ